MSDKLVVFYSWGDNTKAVAEYISEKTGADILELKVRNEYPSEYNACVNKVGRDGKQYEPVLINDSVDLKKYKTIFVGSPCWWGTIANPLRTFLHSYDFAGKVIAPFMTHDTSGLHVQDIKSLCPESKVLEGLGIYNKYQVKDVLYAHELEGKRLIAASVGRRILEARAEKVNRKLDIAFDTVNPATAIELLLINPECIFIAPSTVLDLYPGALTRKVPLRGLGECAWVFAWKKKAELSQLTRDYLAFMRKYPPRMFIEEAFNRKIRSAKHRQM